MEQVIHQLFAGLGTPLLFILIAIVLWLIGKGADILVDSSVALSLHWGVPKMIIGATIVSVGTTLPEASVSVMAAVGGNAGMALGNAIGSIICDTGLIIGIAALLGELPVKDEVIHRQGKLQFAAVLLLSIVSLPVFYTGDGGVIYQWVGFLFLLLLALYIYVSIKWSRGETSAVLEIDSVDVNTSKEIVMLSAGVALVIMTSKLLIPLVEITATRIGIPEGVIAATLVAFGTSLPELVTAVTAVRKGHGELAVGNIVGADILNVLFVVGGAASVTPAGLLVPTRFYMLQIPAMLIIVIAFRIFSKSEHQHITKREGLFLAGIYSIYLTLNFVI